jgi:hypothetical protein
MVISDRLRALRERKQLSQGDYELFYDGEEPPKVPNLPKSKASDGWGGSGEDAKTLHKFRSVLSRTNEKDRRLLLYMAQRMARHRD